LVLAKGYLWIIPSLALLGILVYYPMAANLINTFFSWTVFIPQKQVVGLDNYVKAVNDPIFWTSLYNNVLYAAFSFVFQVCFGLVLAAVIEHFAKGKLRDFLRSVYFLPATVATTVAALLFQFLYNPQIGLVQGLADLTGMPWLAHDWLGDANTAIFTVISLSQWQYTGYVTALFIVAIQRVPRELYESAELDGAGFVRRFFHVTVPMVREMTTLMTIFVITNSFLLFTQVRVMTRGGPNNSSQVLGTWLYHTGFTLDEMGYASVMATVILILSIVVAVFQLSRASKKRVEYT
jgi:raffinose/stachyose/melibiose transport system permease protein